MKNSSVGKQCKGRIAGMEAANATGDKLPMFVIQETEMFQNG